MDIAYLHVVINHFPIMGVPILLAILLLGLWARSQAIQRAALLGLAALGLLTVAVYLSGQGGKDFVEHLPGVSRDAIEAHEDMAAIGLGAMSALATLSLLLFLGYGGSSLLRRSAEAGARPVPALAAWLVVLVALATAAVLGYTGKLGGKIRHTEFADGAQATAGEEDGDEGGRRRRGRDH